MTTADKITSLRLILAPLFFIVYLLPVLFPAGFVKGSQWTVPVLWLFFLCSEITDLIDGKVARKRGEVSDFGKLYDPFADILVRITYFLCFVVTGILPVVFFLVVLYREFGVLFIRILMMKKGVAMGARKGGKLKAVCYMASGVAALLAASTERLNAPGILFTVFRTIALVIFIISVVISVISFVDYLFLYQKTGAGESR
ncbi:MAG: CDP-diacylglycerol--glycerol-3-phosphate 3-phosphatidyltransferase [Treponema sp.]|jgi:CDP-diacylglycerol--glycerol-3-phosphate 3-phosphatidyltransferase|nr:CDP-diacylglycerol--glycerol-3-phosphate 3-phosphatidyltransferase [Treponema sp.]